MSGLPVSAPAGVVLGADVVEDAALVVEAAVVAAHMQRQTIGRDAHHSSLVSVLSLQIHELGA